MVAAGGKGRRLVLAFLAVILTSGPAALRAQSPDDPAATPSKGAGGHGPAPLSVTAPLLVAPTLTYPVGGEQIAAGSTITVTWNTNGAPADTTYKLEYTSTCDVYYEVFFDNVENETSEWTVSHVGGTLDWSRVTSSYYSAVKSWFAGDEAVVNDQYLVSPSIVVPSGGYLTFWHRYLLEESYDGGVVEISADGGATWTDLGPRMEQNGYNATISTNYGSPIAGRQAFTGNSGGWVTTLVNVSSYAGQTVKFRFREADDRSLELSGWWVDDIRVVATPTWTVIGLSAPGAGSYQWTVPDQTGAAYCVRLKGRAPDGTDSAYSTGGAFTITGGTCYDFLPPAGVGAEDVQRIASRWNTTSTDPGWDSALDIDGDGVIGLIDVMQVASRWGIPCS